MIKFLILGVILYIVYISFFKKQVISSKKKEANDADTVVECSKCKTYVTADEAFIADKKYFCSKECLDAYHRS